MSLPWMSLPWISDASGPSATTGLVRTPAAPTRSLVFTEHNALYDEENQARCFEKERAMRWLLAAILLGSAILISGCMHVSPLWPLKVQDESGAVRYG